MAIWAHLRYRLYVKWPHGNLSRVEYIIATRYFHPARLLRFPELEIANNHSHLLRRFYLEVIVNPLTFGGSGPKVLLCIGAHCDDIEIGCGGTLLTLSRRYPQAHFHWVIFTSDAVRESESQHAAKRLLGDRCSVDVQRFRGSYLPFEGSAIKDYFEVVARRLSPDAIFTHHIDDRHQDHRLLGELAWNTFRNHLIFEYEIPKYEGDLGRPNVFVPLTREDLDAKVDCLLACFPSQRQRSWFTAETFTALARLRGIESGAPSGYAEAFHVRKLCL